FRGDDGGLRSRGVADEEARSRYLHPLCGETRQGDVLSWAAASLETLPAAPASAVLPAELRELALAAFAAAAPGAIVELVLPAPAATPERLLELGDGPA